MSSTAPPTVPASARHEATEAVLSRHGRDKHAPMQVLREVQAALGRLPRESLAWLVEGKPMKTRAEYPIVTEAPVWFITGCSTGFGPELARRAIDCGFRTVVTARDPASLEGLAATDQVLVLKLDVARPDQVGAAIEAAQARFGGIDVLVNNAGIGYFAAIEEGEEAQVRKMFAVEGLSDALRQEVEPLGSRVMVVEPSGFRTDWAGRSAEESAHPIDDYVATAGNVRSNIRETSGKQPGDPVRAVKALVQAVESGDPPHHLLLGNDAFDGATAKLGELRTEFVADEAVARAADFPQPKRVSDSGDIA